MKNQLKIFVCQQAWQNVKCKIIKIFLFALCSLLFPLCFLYADFEYLGVGARPAGLSNSYTAISDDVYGIYFNPGGVAFVENSEISAEYARLWLNLTDDSNLSNGFIGYVHPLRDNLNKLGVCWQNFSLIGYYIENILTFSYSRKTSNNLGLGFGLKYMHQNYTMDSYTKIDPIFDYGNKTGKSVIGIDAGILWNFYPDYFLGFSLINLNQPNISLDEKEGETLPLTFNFGLAYRYNYRYSNSFNLSLGLTNTRNDIKTQAGIEKWFHKNKWAIRGGFGFGSRQYFNLSFGSSLRFKKAQIDYSFSFPVSGIEQTYGTHRFTISYKFGTKVLEEKVLSSEEFLKEKEELTKKYQEQITQLENKIAELEIKLKEAERTKISPDVEYLNNRIKTLEFELKQAQEKLKSVQEEKTKSIEVVPSVRPKIEEKPPVPKIRKHTVKEGESLPSIAEKYYGDSTRWKEIYEANKDKIKRGQIVPGQVLIIP
ncbi:MAG: type IX secretion system membrane protein PorP/SprF [Endomicrobiia bacterium]